MRIISKLDVSRFRSLRDCHIDKLGHLTAFAGLNNSGKSNVLRALNAFFLGEVEPGVPLNFERDFYRPELSSKKKKRIRIGVGFVLPKHFRFRKDLAPVQQLVGQSVEIVKEWDPSGGEPTTYLNESRASADAKEADLVRQFLSMISFRYIPNRVLPLDVIRQEHAALRDALVRRLARKAPTHEAIFKEIEATSTSLIKKMGQHFVKLSAGLDGVRLKTPNSWAEILFALGYQLSDGGVELDDHLQGSGIQSLLMLETLSLIDRDYFQQFGWRQAAVWAVEEPESSLHVSLEAQVAAYLAEIARDTKGRLQIIATTHSEFLIQYANKAHFLTKGGGGTREESTADRREVLSLSAKAGVSRWVHPLLYMPLDPVVLVEGEQDVAFVSRALRLLRPKKRIRVVTLREFAGDDAGGVDRMLQYLKENRSAVQARSAEAPLVVVIDWDASSKKGGFEKALAGAAGAFVLVWPEDEANPDLGKSFRGIERFFSDRIIHEAEKRRASIGRTKKGKGTAIVEPAAYADVKKTLNEIVIEGLSQEDLLHSQAFLQQVVGRCEQRQ